MQLQSKLFPALFDRLDDSHRLTVFDAGAALPETLEFFSQYKCRLHFVDLYSEPLVRQQLPPTEVADVNPMARRVNAAQSSEIDDEDTEWPESKWYEAFQQVLQFPADTRFDICLLWDVLNYLSSPALLGFSRALMPYLKSTTRAHGFGVLNARTALLNHQYGVLQHDSLSVRERQEPQLASYPRPQAELNKALPCFDIGRGLLLPDGRLEMLLKSVTA